MESFWEFVIDALNVALRIQEILFFVLYVGRSCWGFKNRSKGILRKCRECGHFNELDTRFCVVCGEEMVRGPNGDQRQPSVGPSYKTIALVIGMIFLAGLAVKLAITFSEGGGLSKLNSAPVLTSTPMVKVDEAQVHGEGILLHKWMRCKWTVLGLLIQRSKKRPRQRD